MDDTGESYVGALRRDLASNGLRYLANVGSAAVFVGSFWPLPQALGMGVGATEMFRFIAMVVAGERLFGSEVRDYVVAVWMTWQLTWAAYYAIVGHSEATHDALIRNVCVYVLGALLIRWMKTFESTMITADLTATDVADELGQSLPIRQAVAVQPYLAEGVAMLRELVVGSPIQALFRLPDDFDPLDELSHVRVRSASLNVLTNALFSAQYMAFNRSLMINAGSRRPHAVVHELMHALHHKAVMRGITREHLALLLTRVHKDRAAAFVDDMIDRVGDFLALPGDVPIPDAIRWDGADMVFYCMLEDKRPMEAVGSYFDDRGWASLSRYVEKVGYYYALPFAVIAGMPKTNGIFQSYAGYLDKPCVDHMLDQGVVDALLSPQ